MQDQILDLVVVVLPTLLSLVGVLVTLEPWEKRHKYKWRGGLILMGLIVSGLTCWQQARQRAKANSDARELREQVVQRDRDNTQKFNALTQRVNLFILQNSRPQGPIVAPKVPTAEEIASALGSRLKEMQPAASPPPEKKPPTSVIPVPVVPLIIQPPKMQPCRGDRLSECSDEQLLEWGKPLVANIEAIENDFMAGLKKLDDIKGGNWFREVIGIGDKDSRWLKAYAMNEDKAADRFRDCCAENAIGYHKELAQRTGGGLEKIEMYEWAQNLLKPVKSKEWKNARQDAGRNVINVLGDLHSLQIELEIVARKR